MVRKDVTTRRLAATAITNNAALAFNRSDALTVAGAISGTGVVNQIGTGTTRLTSNNTYSGTTTISAGTLDIGGGGATGTLGSGNVVNNATLQLNRSDDITVANVISGTSGGVALVPLTFYDISDVEINTGAKDRLLADDRVTIFNRSDTADIHAH